jgi:hypothetical protein
MAVVRRLSDLWHDHMVCGQGAYQQALCLRL